jgi:DNA-binding LytR/AlgR family response regulator
MHYTNYQLSNHLDNKLQSRKSLYVSVLNGTDVHPGSMELIRFEERRERYIWVHPDEICFVKSADHYVKSLIQCGNHAKWMSRHSTLKELLDMLPAESFIRLNKFYLVNLKYFSHIDESEKVLYFKDASSIDIPHRISPFLRHLLKKSNT